MIWTVLAIWLAMVCLLNLLLAALVAGEVWADRAAGTVDASAGIVLFATLLTNAAMAFFLVMERVT